MWTMEGGELSSDFDVLLKKLQKVHIQTVEEFKREIKQRKQGEEEYKQHCDKISEDLQLTNQQKAVLEEDNHQLKLQLKKLKDGLQTRLCEQCEKSKIKIEKEQLQWLELITQKEQRVTTLETEVQSLRQQVRDLTTLTSITNNPAVASTHGRQDKNTNGFSKEVDLDDTEIPSQVFSKVTKPLSKLSVSKAHRKIRYREAQKTSPESNSHPHDMQSQGLVFRQEKLPLGRDQENKVSTKTTLPVQETQQKQTLAGRDGVEAVTADCERVLVPHAGWTQNLVELQNMPKRLEIENTQDVIWQRSKNIQAVLAPDTCYPDTHAMLKSQFVDCDEEMAIVDGGKCPLESHGKDEPKITVPETLPAEIETYSEEEPSCLMSPPAISSTPTQRFKDGSTRSKVSDGPDGSLTRNGNEKFEIDALTPIERSESQMPCYNDSEIQSPVFTKPTKATAKPECLNSVVHQLKFSADSLPSKDAGATVTPKFSKPSHLRDDESYQSETSPLLLKPLLTRLQNKQTEQETSDDCNFKLIIPTEHRKLGKENSPSPDERGPSFMKLQTNPKKRQRERENVGGKNSETTAEEEVVISPPRKHLISDNHRLKDADVGDRVEDSEWIDMAKMVEQTKRQQQERTLKSKSFNLKAGTHGPGIQKFFKPMEKINMKKFVQTTLSAESFKCEPSPGVSKVKEFNGGVPLTTDTQHDPYVNEAIVMSLRDDNLLHQSSDVTADFTRFVKNPKTNDGFKEPPPPVRLFQHHADGNSQCEITRIDGAIDRETKTEDVNCGTLTIEEENQFTLAEALNGSVDPALELSKLDEDSEILVSGKNVTSPKFDCDEDRVRQKESEAGSFQYSLEEEFTESYKFGKVDRVYPLARKSAVVGLDVKFLEKQDSGKTSAGEKHRNMTEEECQLDDVDPSYHGYRDEDSCVDMFDGNDDVKSGEDDDQTAQSSKVTELDDQTWQHHNPANVNHHEESTLDSFNRVPRISKSPNYKHVQVVRKQEERRKLNAFDCKQCQEYFGGLGLSDSQKAERMKECSRHRGKYIPPSTPEHYWEMDMPSTQTCQERGYMQAVSQNQPQRRRRRQPYAKRF
ncbi:DNA endonuclease RBBP8-like isoform X2 [Ptychodera flava]